jgi:CHAT domain-containing protein/tetratricopeptide (TPR) repeat protein
LVWGLGLGAVFAPASGALAQSERDVADANRRAKDLFDHGYCSRAVAEYERAVALARRVYGANDANVERIRANLARAYQYDGQYDKAEPLFRDAITGLKNKKAGADEVGHAMLNFGSFYGGLGQYGEAVKWTAAALKVFESDGWNGPAAEARINLGNLYGLTGNYDEALGQYQAALRFRRAQFGDKDSRTADVVSRIAAVYQARRNFTQAETLYRHRLTVREAERGRDSDEFGLSYLGTTLLELGRFGEAEALFQRLDNALGRRFPTDHHPRAFARASLAIAAAYQGRWDEAVACMDQSRRALRSTYLRAADGLSESEQLTKLREYTGDELGHALSLGWAHRDTPAAAEASAGWLLNGKSLLFEAMAERTLLLRDARLTGLKDVVEELRAVRRQLGTLYGSELEQGGVEDFRRRSAALLEKEARLSRRLGGAGGHPPHASAWVEAAEVRRALTPDTVFVDVVRTRVRDYADKGGPGGLKYDDRYLAWVMTPSAGVKVTDLGPAAEVEALVADVLKNLHAVEQRRAQTNEEFRKVLAEKLPAAEEQRRLSEVERRHFDAEGELEKDFRLASARLSQRVLHPLLEHARGARRWIISPDSRLWLVPWAALVLPDGTYFVERFSLRQVISGRDLVARAGPDSSGPPLVVANPNYSLGVTGPDTARRSRQIPLPEVQAMAEQLLPRIKAIAGAEPEAYFGDRATEQVVKATRGPRIALLGTHGGFQNPGEITPGISHPLENPFLRCVLCFAGCDRKPAAGSPADDGLLTGVEVLGCDFRGTELVVLSACQTAQGDVHGGQAAAGMRSAFLLAGARAVQATLWSVDVQATVIFTLGFFDRLAAGGPPAEALAESQRALIARWKAERGSAHPFYWAPYTLTGVGP